VGQATCEVGIDMGTSMATPIVAGAAAVVRQYFQQGWYPSGAAVTAHGFSPSAPLVKAVMLGAAVQPYSSVLAFSDSRLQNAAISICVDVTRRIDWSGQ